MEVDKKQMSIWAGIAALVFGGGGVGGYTLFDTVLEMGDDRWVTIAAQTKQLQYEIEDELADILFKIDKGTATNRDLIRKAVLEERLRNLK